jgi:hypothetical protein
MVHKDIYLTAARGGDRPHMPERNARTVTRESAFRFWFQLAVPTRFQRLSLPYQSLSMLFRFSHYLTAPVLRHIHTGRYPQKGATRRGLQSHIELVSILLPPHTSGHDPRVIANEHFAIAERVCRHKKRPDCGGVRCEVVLPSQVH